MAEATEEEVLDPQQIESETPLEDVFRPHSVDTSLLVNGITYSHFSGIPEALQNDISMECVMGVDEAGRGPVLGLSTISTRT